MIKKVWRPILSILSAFLITYIVLTRDTLTGNEVELIEWLLTYSSVYAVARSVEKIRGVER